MLGAIERTASARAVVTLVRIAFGAMAVAEAIDRRLRRRYPTTPSLVDRLVHQVRRDSHNAKGGRA